MSRMRHTTLKQYLTEIRTLLKQSHLYGPRAIRMTACRALLETMTDDVLVYVECSGIDVDRKDVRYFLERYLRYVADRSAKGITLGRVRDEPIYLGEQLADPCKRGHTVAECPKRRRK
jgi:hypothetical protein